MTVDEYRRTSFEDVEPDYVDGELEERNGGDRGHSTVQVLLVSQFASRQAQLGLDVLIEIRVQIDERRFRVADVAVWHERVRGRGVPKTRPALTIEILSPEDRLTRMLPRISDYFRAGVSTIWVIDPDDRRAMEFTPNQPGGVLTETLRSADLNVEVPLSAVLPPIDL